VMLSLRFPNSGIRTKATRRRGGQPRPAPMQGRPGRGQGLLQGGSRLQGARKGLPPATSPTTSKGGCQ
ncbi:hypothetical protein GW17_00042357, partial [Ensete ventricosum]